MHDSFYNTQRSTDSVLGFLLLFHIAHSGVHQTPSRPPTARQHPAVSTGHAECLPCPSPLTKDRRLLVGLLIKGCSLLVGLEEKGSWWMASKGRCQPWRKDPVEDVLLQQDQDEEGELQAGKGQQKSPAEQKKVQTKPAINLSQLFPTILFKPCHGTLCRAGSNRCCSGVG